MRILLDKWLDLVRFGRIANDRKQKFNFSNEKRK